MNLRARVTRIDTVRQVVRVFCESIAATERGRNERRPCADCDGKGEWGGGSLFGDSCRGCGGSGLDEDRRERRDHPERFDNYGERIRY